MVPIAAERVLCKVLCAAVVPALVVDAQVVRSLVNCIKYEVLFFDPCIISNNLIFFPGLFYPTEKIDKHLGKLRESGALDNDRLGINGEKIDSVADFPGGKKKLSEHCGNIMSEIFTRPRFTRRVPHGKFTIRISFIVNADGSLSDFLPITQFGYALEEAITAIYQRSGVWIPAK